MTDSKPKPSLNQLAQHYAEGEIDRTTYRCQRRERLDELTTNHISPDCPKTDCPKKTKSPSEDFRTIKSDYAKKTKKSKWFWLMLAMLVLAAVVALGISLGIDSHYLLSSK